MELKFKLPGIGMRIIKSAIAIAFCYIINILRGDAGMVFYSQLAALWCIQMYRSNTKKNAIQRIIGTSVGAIYGLFYLLIYPKLLSLFTREILVDAIFVSLFLLFVLYTTVVLKKQQASYFSCVVFLSIVVNHISDVVPALFVWNRFLDTMIGIAIGIIINDIRICINPDKETLFVSGLDETLLDESEILSPFSKVELNRMIDSGLKFTISTIRTPASLREPMRDIRLNLPVIAMDGAVLYDTKKNAYLETCFISSDITNRLKAFILSSNLCWYINVVIDDVLIIYYDDNNDNVNTNLVKTLKVSPYRNYIKGLPPTDDGTVYFMLLDETSKIKATYESLINQDFTDNLRIVTYESKDFIGYSYIKIYDKSATKENMLQKLMERINCNKTLTIGTIPDQYDITVKENSTNEVVRIIRKNFEPFLYRVKKN